MKKYFTFFFFVLLIGLILWFPSNKKNEAGNSIPSYEYYYNEDTLAEGDDMQTSSTDKEMEKNVAAKEKDGVKKEAEKPITIKNEEVKMDLDPESLTVFINKEHGLPPDYIPKNLTVPNVLFNFSHMEERKQLRKVASKALEDLFTSANEKNLTLYAISGYRSYKRQDEIYTKNVRQRGSIATNAVSAVPGYSEHQSGLAMDVSCSSINFRLSEAFSGTPEGRWLAKNAHLHGFIIRYPKGKSHITGYSYEPWHVRYVGKELATYLYENSLTLEEYYNYEPKQNLIKESGSDMLVDVDVDASQQTTMVPMKTQPPAKTTMIPKKTQPPTATTQPIKTPKPTKIPKPTATPTKKPKKTETPKPTKSPKTKTTPSSSQIPESNNSPVPKESSSELSEPIHVEPGEAWMGGNTP